MQKPDNYKYLGPIKERKQDRSRGYCKLPFVPSDKKPALSLSRNQRRKKSKQRKKEQPFDLLSRGHI